MKKIDLGKGLSAIVDDDDFNFLMKKGKWRVTCEYGINYAVRDDYVNGKNKRIRMHRLIMDAPKGMVVDHINGNGLDNRKANLRICKNSDNVKNSKKSPGCYSIYKGVTWDKRRLHWTAQIKVNYKNISLGRFENEIEAAKAYDAAAIKHFGEFARPNFGGSDRGPG